MNYGCRFTYAYKCFIVLFKTTRIISENLTIFQPDIEYLRQRGSSVSASGPSLSLVNSKLEAVMEQHVLTAKGSTFCQTRMVPLHIITLNHILSDRWNTQA